MAKGFSCGIQSKVKRVGMHRRRERVAENLVLDLHRVGRVSELKE